MGTTILLCYGITRSFLINLLSIRNIHSLACKFHRIELEWTRKLAHLVCECLCLCTCVAHIHFYVIFFNRNGNDDEIPFQCTLIPNLLRFQSSRCYFVFDFMSYVIPLEENILRQSPQSVFFENDLISQIYTSNRKKNVLKQLVV